jgi:amidase
MSIWILRFDDGADTHPDAIRVAVKDIIDVAGTPTTAGSRVVAATALPATSDAACMAGLRAAQRAGRIRLVGKTNLHELAFGVSGINPWFGTPPNPIDPSWVPGGSSSGSAVAVGSGEADVALGTDTGGSIRIPAACCGVVGLKTTWGRLPLDGIRPLAPSFDTVGPMARDVEGIVTGMALLEPGFIPDRNEAVRRVGRVRLPARPDIDAAIDAALARADLEVIDVALPGWSDADEAAVIVLMAEAWQINGALARAHPGELGADVTERLARGARLDPSTVAAARRHATAWRDELDFALAEVDLLAWPALAEPPPPLAQGRRVADIRYSLPVNLAGAPAICLPVPMPGPWPASVQLVGPRERDELVIAGAFRVESGSR